MNKEKKERAQKRHLSLTVIFSILIFLSLLITMLVVLGVVGLLIRENVLNLGSGKLDTNYLIGKMALISIVFGAAISALVTHIPLKSVNEIIRAINRLASGDFKTRLHLGKRISLIPAIAELNESFNKMAQELENTELFRSDFINYFSHEFKTPLMSIAGFSALLKRENLTEEQKKEYIDVIEKESLRLSKLTTQVLNMTRVENQTILTDVTSFNLSEQIRSAILMLESKWSRKKVEFNLEFGEVTGHGNEELLQQVWINLLDNAIKFTTDYGSIRVGIQQVNFRIIVTIENTGSTIPEEQIEHIFQKFYQADLSHATEGNGIGLAVVQKIVTLHKGTVTASSSNDVTTFTVSLPA
ncbi:MAG: HAMP domain-containing histidine kinase [Christensenellaceae bacterium]|nr:HAMP domain-containing histidine kinase [Christensenellaceae bacterium]